jgi:hypothetical protein
MGRRNTTLGALLETGLVSEQTIKLRGSEDIAPKDLQLRALGFDRCAHLLVIS